MSVLPRRFYARPALLVARDLLGQELRFRSHEGTLGGLVVEVEAYLGGKDPASHAFRGLTQRNRAMFGPPGHAYVYFTYGMHHCVNVVTGIPGTAEAVLVRALEPLTNLPLWQARRPDLPLHLVASGPGRVTQALGLTRAHDGLDLVRSDLVLVRGPGMSGPVACGPRVGIRVAREKRWRFWLPESPAVSRARGASPGPWPGRKRAPETAGAVPTGS